MKGQGLPFSTIVLAIMSILILVLIVLFFSGGVGKLFPTFHRFTDEVQQARAECQQLLMEISTYLQGASLPSADEIHDRFSTSRYCTKLFKIGENRSVKCYHSQIGITADFVVYTSAGEPISCTAPRRGNSPCHCP